MSDDLVKQAMAELADVVRCRCNEAYTGRGLHDPDCQCDSAEAVKVVADRIEELEAKLGKAVDGLRDAAEDMDGYVGKGYGDPYRELTEELTNTQKGQ